MIIDKSALGRRVRVWFNNCIVQVPSVHSITCGHVCASLLGKVNLNGVRMTTSIIPFSIYTQKLWFS